MAQEEDRPCSLCGISPSTIRELRYIISSQDDEKIRELTKQVEEQVREIAELKQRLSHYENSNSPPSKNSLLYREMKSRRREEARVNWEGAAKNDGSPVLLPKKPGRKDGHVGATQVFAPTGSPVVHTMERCPKCDSTRLSVTSTESRTVVDVPEPLPYDVKEHIINVYACSGCGADGLIPESARRELPSSSVVVTNQRSSIVTLGKNVLSIASLPWSVARLPRRKISYVIESLYHLKLSPATIGHALENVSESLKAFHEKVRKGVNRSGRANFDETSMPVAGKKGWIWIAATKKIRIRSGRHEQRERRP